MLDNFSFVYRNERKQKKKEKKKRIFWMIKWGKIWKIKEKIFKINLQFNMKFECCKKKNPGKINWRRKIMLIIQMKCKMDACIPNACT